MGDEQSKWAIALNKHHAKFANDTVAVEGEAASRGFGFMPGKTQMALVQAGAEFKMSLTEEAGGIYKEFRDRIFQVTQALRRYRLSLAKLDLNLWRERELNRMAIEAAEFEAEVDRNKADIQRAAATIEARNYNVIRLRAITEREVNYWKGVAVEAEGRSLSTEEELAAARLATAQERLRVIDYMRESVRAEAVAVEAEKTKVTALQGLIAVKEELAQVKLGMIPLYENKAEAKTRLATAVTEEAGALVEIAKLGTQRAEQKRAIWAAESAYFAARLGLMAQEGAREIAQLDVDVARNNARVEVQTAHNAARTAVANAKMGLEKDQVALKYSLAALRREGEISSVQETAGQEATIIAGGYSSSVNSIEKWGKEAAATVENSADNIP